MKNSTNKLENEQELEMLPEYDLDFSKSRPNKFAAILKNQERLISIDADVFRVFNDSEKVNNALRNLIKAMPKRESKQNS
jgi:alkyl hydroperoxide reductase subunit AhpC